VSYEQRENPVGRYRQKHASAEMEVMRVSFKHEESIQHWDGQRVFDSVAI
jgi:hypothetical protein